MLGLLLPWMLVWQFMQPRAWARPGPLVPLAAFGVLRGIGVLPVFAGLLGLLLLIGSLAATWAREGR